MVFLKRTTVEQWTWIGVFNLLLVASMGVLMRLKFLFALPFINLKHLQHAHSHFAFVGWVSHMLILLLVVVIFRLQRKDVMPPRYSVVLLANLLCSFGMLFSFIYQGYGTISITFSTLTILVSYYFAIILWEDIRRQQLDKKIAKWFIAALIFLVISSFGTFYLAYIMASHQSGVKEQLGAVYFYLHFQYNGWFFFAIMGLVSHMLGNYGQSARYSDILYKVLCLVTAPLYLLSVLWWDMGDILYALLVLSALAQFGVWLYWMICLYKNNQNSPLRIPTYLKKIMWLICWAVVLKFMLQVLSVIPSLSHYVYGYRPVIIGYLHLVLLVIVSLLILSYLYDRSLIRFDKQAWIRFCVFILGVVLNEVFLAMQAILSLLGLGFPRAHIYLLVASLIMGIGLLGMLRHSFIWQKKNWTALSKQNF